MMSSAAFAEYLTCHGVLTDDGRVSMTLNPLRRLSSALDARLALVSLWHDTAERRALCAVECLQCEPGYTLNGQLVPLIGTFPVSLESNFYEPRWSQPVPLQSGELTDTVTFRVSTLRHGDSAPAPMARGALSDWSPPFRSIAISFTIIFAE